jgi:hypothetical protein
MLALEVALIGTFAMPTSTLAGPPSEASPRSVMPEPVEVQPITAHELPIVTSGAVVQVQSDDGPPSKPKPPRIPDDGKGSVVLGSMLLVGGVAVTGLGIGLLYEPGVMGIIGTAIGIASVGTGIGITCMGVGRQRRYREWQATSPLRSTLRRGNGLIMGGVATLVGSGALIVLTSVGWASSSSTPWWGPTGIGLGSAGVVVSGVLLGIGGRDNIAFERWRKSQASVLPTASFGPQGMQLGLTGRF